MTNQEALDIFVSCATLDCEHCNMSFRGCEDKPRFNEMRDMVISALEKQIPKKPIIKPWSPARCPSCGNELSTHHGDGYYAHRTFMDYCDNKDCLQRLDWRNEDE